MNSSYKYNKVEVVLKAGHQQVNRTSKGNTEFSGIITSVSFTLQTVWLTTINPSHICWPYTGPQPHAWPSPTHDSL